MNVKGIRINASEGAFAELFKRSLGHEGFYGPGFLYSVFDNRIPDKFDGLMRVQCYDQERVDEIEYELVQRSGYRNGVSIAVYQRIYLNKTQEENFSYTFNSIEDRADALVAIIDVDFK